MVKELTGQMGRFTENFNAEWKFLKLTQKGGLSKLAVEETDFDDSGWERITLPHTWNSVDGCDGWSGIDEGGENYYRGMGGYRKLYFFDNERFSDKEIFLEFKGANTITELFVNGESVGIHEGGYSAFRFDVTDYVKLGEENSIVVKVSNAPTDYIAPINIQGDFTKMGGIYRDVTLIAAKKIHINLMDFGSSGIYVTPKNITSENVEINLLIKLSNDGHSDENITVKAEIYDMENSVVALEESNMSIPAKTNSNELYQMSDEIYSIFTELNGLAKVEDETRLITFADAQFWGRFLELPADVVGYNRYFGWYKEAGPVEKFGEWLDGYHGIKEKRPICVSEYGGGAAISQHKDNIDWQNDIDAWGERHYENYQSAMHEKIWAQFSQRQYLWGKYVWCMFDFASDGRQEGDTKGQNDKGLVTREREPKDSFYFYKSIWNSEPMLYITEKRFIKRPSKVPQVKAYANAESVELFINGVSAGTVERSSLDVFYSTVFIWNNISLKSDEENEIKAVAIFADGKTIEDTAVWLGV